jgi:hypothetical protein
LAAVIAGNNESAARLLGYTRHLMPEWLYEEEHDQTFLRNITARAIAGMNPGRFEQLLEIGRWMDEDTAIAIAFDV